MKSSDCSPGPRASFLPEPDSTGASGRAALQVQLVYGQSTITSAVAEGPLKLLTPRSRGQSVWAYTSSFGGGLVAGDQTRLDVSLGAGARCFVTTQASTKIYKNPAGLPCSHVTRGTLQPGAVLVFAPDAVQPFAGSTYAQRQEFHLAPGAGLALVDGVTSGRAARGERWEFANYRSRTDVFIGGERVFVDSILLSPSTLPAGASHRTGRYNHFATLLLIGEPLRAAAECLVAKISARPVEKRAALLCSAGAVPQGAVLRLAGVAVEDVVRETRLHLEPMEAFLGENPWPIKW